ncbi:MAG: hypothetical protein ABII21_02210 [bacterium]
MRTQESPPSTNFGFSILEGTTDSAELLKSTWANIISDADYIPYLENIFKQYNEKHEPAPHKAWIQLEMAKLGINESETRIVPTNDITTAFHYGMHLLEQGHREIWLGTADKDDSSDPQGKQNINPPLYRHIHNMKDLLFNLVCTLDFAKDHPNSFLKIFPQDKERPSLGSMLISDGEGDKFLRIKIRRGEYTTTERHKRKKDSIVELQVDLNGSIPIVIVKNKSDLIWLRIIFNSLELFDKLDLINTRGSNIINPEFLIFGDGDATEVSFFTDIIFGAKPKSKHYLPTCPRISPIIRKIISNETRVIFTNTDSDLPLLIEDRIAALEAGSILRTALFEIEQGGGIATQDIVAAIAQLRRAQYPIPKLITNLSQTDLSQYRNRPTSKDIASIIHTILNLREPNLDDLLSRKAKLKNLIQLPKI